MYYAISNNVQKYAKLRFDFAFAWPGQIDLYFSGLRCHKSHENTFTSSKGNVRYKQYFLMFALFFLLIAL